MGVTWGRGRTHQHATRLPRGEGGYNTHSTLPMRAAYTPHPRRRLQPTGIIKHARVLRGSRKNISPFASCLCLATVPRPSALFPSEPPALLIAKNHFSSVQLSSGFSSCVFSFSIFLYFFVRSLQKCFSSPGCTCCAGSSFVAGFSFRRKFA